MTKKSINLGGRPTKKDNVIVQKLEYGFEHDMSVETCCKYAGIAKSSYYDWIKNDDSFRTKMEIVQINMFVLALKGQKKLIEQGDQTTIREFLKRRIHTWSMRCFWILGIKLVIITKDEHMFKKQKITSIFFSNITVDNQKRLHIAVKPLYKELSVINGADDATRTRNQLLGRQGL